MSLGPIPYFDPPAWRPDLPVLGPTPLGIFGPIVVIGVLIGMQICLKHAARRDLDEGVARDHLFWTLIFGFVISHWISVIFYFPERIQENPWVLLQVWNGLSSVGGFFGAFIGMLWFAKKHKQPMLVFADMNIYGLVTGMIFGRLSCALVHDHPGKIVEAVTPLAVGPWPCRCPEGGRRLSSCCVEGTGIFRYDLGLVEFSALLVLGALLYGWYGRTLRPHGRITGFVAACYGTIRFSLDFFRETTAGNGVSTPDLRYFGLTIAQYFSVAFFLAGIYLLVRKPRPHDDDYAKESDYQAKAKAKAEAEVAEDPASSENTPAP